MVAATYTITDERKKSWDFSTPYRTDYVGLMVKKRSGFTSIEDLDGKVIGVSQGATTQGLIEQMIKDNGFSCKPSLGPLAATPSSRARSTPAISTSSPWTAPRWPVT